MQHTYVLRLSVFSAKIATFNEAIVNTKYISLKGKGSNVRYDIWVSSRQILAKNYFSYIQMNIDHSILDWGGDIKVLK